MKKLLLIGLLLSLSTGCGRGWLPCLFRGARCNSGSCIGAAPVLPSGGCTTCADGATSAGYGSYEGEVVGGDSYYGGETIVGDSYAGGYTGGQVINNGINYGSGAITSPTMQTLPNPVQPAP